jgi:diacylglycerol O-acyltransferase
LRRLFGRVMSQRLDRSKPLWETWLVEGLADGQWALISKTHHCMIDGVSGSEMMAVLLDLTPEQSSVERAEWTPSVPSTGEVTRAAVWSLATSGAEQMRAVRSAVRRPTKLAREIRDVVGGALSLSSSLKPIARTGLTGPIGSQRVVAWAETPLQDVKTIRAALGGTINDVVLAAVTNGFRQLVISHGESVDGRVVRTLVPVSVRSKRDDGAAAGDGTMSNKISTMFAALPVGIADPAERLAAVTRQLTDLKQSKQANAAEVLISLSATAPAGLLALGARSAARAAARPIAMETVTTNVPGPHVPLYANGRKMLRVYPYVPLGPQCRTGVSIFSYDGMVTFGVTGDRDSIPDIETLARGITDGLSELVALATPTKKSARRREPARAKKAAPKRKAAV